MISDRRCGSCSVASNSERSDNSFISSLQTPLKNLYIFGHVSQIIWHIHNRWPEPVKSKALWLSNCACVSEICWCLPQWFQNCPIIEPYLNHWGRVTHICVSKLTNIGSDNGLSPGRRQSIIWTSAGILLIGPLGANFSEILIEFWHFHSRKCGLKWRLRSGGHFVSVSMG